jgi:hypothetical protein
VIVIVTKSGGRVVKITYQPPVLFSELRSGKEEVGREKMLKHRSDRSHLPERQNSLSIVRVTGQ